MWRETAVSSWNRSSEQQKPCAGFDILADREQSVQLILNECLERAVHIQFNQVSKSAMRLRTSTVYSNTLTNTMRLCICVRACVRVPQRDDLISAPVGQ